MIAAEIEARICAALAAAIGEHTAGAARRSVMRGRWGDASEAKSGPELSPVGVVIDVGVAPGSWEKFLLPKATFACSVDIRFENASAVAARTTVVPTADAVERLLARWQMNKESLVADIGLEGFRPFSAKGTGGNAPVFVETLGTWSISFTFEVTGLVACELN